MDKITLQSIVSRSFRDGAIFGGLEMKKAIQDVAPLDTEGILERASDIISKLIAEIEGIYGNEEEKN